MHLTLVDRQMPLITAWRTAFADCSDVTVQHGSIFDVACDALISPANSFGFMDGGLDLLISQHIGWHVQERLQTRIRERHHGELLVGMAEIVPTDNAAMPYVIAAPTMRVPMILGADSVNVYLAMRAVLLLMKHGTFDDGAPISQRVQRVAIAGMGTGVGRVPVTMCAHQMRQAYNDVILQSHSFPSSWHEAQTRHQLLYTTKPRDLQY